MHPNTDFIHELQKRMRGPVRVDRASRVLYSTDASIYQIEPLGVAIPRDQDDLQAAVELAAKYEIPIIARGSGSGLAGQAIGAGLIVDCSRWLDNICEINPEERTAVVEPGVILAALNKAAAKYGLQFGPDPASAERATMGGVIANNATGAHSIIYGMTADHLRAADVILSDGSAATWEECTLHSARNALARTGEITSAVMNLREKYADAIRRSYPQSWRNSAGYRLNYLLPWSPSTPPLWDAGAGGAYPPVGSSTINLAHLLAGSEGTLAVIRRARVRLVPRPRASVLAVLAYATIADACDDVPRLLNHRPSAIELIPQSIVRLAQSVPAYAAQAAILAMDAEALLVVEFGGEEMAALLDSARALKPAVLAETPHDQTRIWNVRKVGLGLLASRTGDAKTVAFIEDCAIPVQKLGAFVRGVEVILGEHGVQAEYYAHASAGCLHIRPILDLKRQVSQLRSIAQSALELTLSLGGSMSSEHGDGLARSEWLRRTYGEEVLEAMHSLKQAADPTGILNPGKILDAPPMDANLRFGAAYAAREWASSLDFSREGGLAGAIEQCNGQGVCRKFDGTMCPSFQASREEMHSTRGRANLLRALISDPRRAGALTAARTAEWEDAHSALDMCLACKGCKSECPSGVDMAKLKYAFQEAYYRSHARPLRDYIFGYFHTVSALLSMAAPLANAVMQFGPTRRLIARVAGITAARPFPRYTSVRPRPNPGGTTRVLFLSDSFTHYIEPQVEQAAFDILGRLGFEVVVLPMIGAGASLLSKGFVDPARRHAARVLESIRRLDPEGHAIIIGLEPPEVYTLKNDYMALLPGRQPELAELSRRTWMLEEFLIRSDRMEELRSAFQKKVHPPPAVKFQPHCHQRAEPPAGDGLPSGAGATVHLLRSCGFDAELIDSGCCGMAGTFGYEREHYELSMQVGALKLFPAIKAARQSTPDLVLAATGSACRLQIEQGASAPVEHPVRLIARYMEIQ